MVVVELMVVVVMGKSNLVREKREKESSFNPEFAPLCPGYTGWGGEEEKPRRKWERQLFSLITGKIPQECGGGMTNLMTNIENE